MSSCGRVGVTQDELVYDNDHSSGSYTLRFPKNHPAGPVVAIAVALVLAACSAGASAGGGDNGNLSLNVVSPADGADVPPGFTIEAESNVPLDTPETGEHHLHFYVDTDINASDYQIVYGNSAPVEAELTPGEHTIIVSLRNADHSDAGPQQTITVNVTDDAGAGSSGAPAPSDAAAPPTDDSGY